MEPRRTKFYLDKRNSKIMGVCSGIAAFTGFDVTWIRIAMFLSIFMTSGTMLFIYPVIGWIADDMPRQYRNEDEDEQRFWQGVRANPARSTRDVRSRFRDIDRRLADVETYYTSRNSRLANEIDSLK
jgi:phage shock protein C